MLLCQMVGGGRGYPIQSWGGGYPIQSWCGGIPYPVMVRGGIPSRLGQGVPQVPPIQSWDGYPPIQTWDGVPPILTWDGVPPIQT